MELILFWRVWEISLSALFQSNFKEWSSDESAQRIYIVDLKSAHMRVTLPLILCSARLISFLSVIELS